MFTKEKKEEVRAGLAKDGINAEKILRIAVLADDLDVATAQSCGAAACLQAAVALVNAIPAKK